MALGVGASTALFLLIGALVVTVRKRMIERDQRETETLARVLANIHRPKDGGAA